MDILELQRRANVLVEQVNNYEANLAEENINEEEVLAQQKFADIYCIRPVLKLLFGDSLESKLDRTLNNNVSLPIFASSAPMWNTKLDLLDSTIDITKDKHEFMNNIDMLNNHNMIQLDATQNSLSYNNSSFSDREIRTRQGINFSYSSNIRDAVATESQLANVFKWNTTTDSTVKNNIVTIYRQVPGVVMYYVGQGGYDWKYTPTISHSTGSTLNEVTFNYPFFNGAAYLKTPIWETPHNKIPIESQDLAITYALEISYQMALKMFIPGTHYALGKLESPQQIFIPAVEPPQYPSSGTHTGTNLSTYNYQAHALYHELVFKNRRKGASENGFDFIPTLDTVADNDPQGLATRLTLAKNKKYYINRPFFNELEPESKFDTSKLADSIIENSQHIEDYYSYNTDYFNTATSTYFDTSTAIISPNTSSTPTLTCKITCGTDADSATGDNSTKYICFAFVPNIDWNTISKTNPQQILSTGTKNLYCLKHNDNIGFGWDGWNSGASIEIPLSDLTDENNELIISSTIYGVRLFSDLQIYNKSTGEVTNKGRIYNEAGTSNYTPIIYVDVTAMDIKPRGINISSINGRTFDGDVGQLREFDKTNNINRLIDLSTANHIDRPMTDSEFFNDYKLNYETYAKAFDQPL